MQNKILQKKRVMRTTLLVLLLSVARMGNGYAQEFTIGNLNYSVNEDGTTVTVTGHVNGTSATGSLNIPASVAYIGHFYTVTTIGQDAFYDCSSLTSVSFPNTLTSIGRRAFSRCRDFTSITLPASLVFVGLSAFNGCSNIEYTNYLGSLGQWCEIVFEHANSNPIYYSHNLFINGIEVNEAVIPETATHIGDYVFCCCESLSFLYIPSSVSSISPSAFVNCANLQQIIVTEDNPKYDSRNDCNAIIETCSNTLIVGSNSTVIPNTVTTIGTNAFSQRGRLESIYIPPCLESIQYAAFYYCGGLTQIVVSPENPVYNSQNNCNAIIETSTNILIAGCQNTVIPETVTVIDEFAFSGRAGLMSISIPESVTSIGYYAFHGCTSLNTVISYNTIPPALGDFVFFYGVPCTSLTVPCGYASAYEVSDWANYFSIFEEDCASHSINIDEGTMSGGSINTSVDSTNMGEEVQIIVTPEEGSILSSLIVNNFNNPDLHVYVYPIGKSDLTYGFIMPPFDVVITATFGPATAIGENNDALASVYPSPAKDQIKIEAEDLKHITISNMLGQIIYDGNVIGNEFIYDFSIHNAGIYLIRIETANGVAVKKVSVTR